MRIRPDFRHLLFGRLVYDETVPVLDDVRFERILRGFSAHYEVTTHDSNRFTFARGEGYTKFEGIDAFAYVDLGEVQRLRTDNEIEHGGNIVLMPPRFGAVRFILGMRVVLAFWAFALLCAWFFVGGSWLWWLIGLIAVYAAHITMIVRSLRTKLERWLAKSSWN